MLPSRDFRLVNSFKSESLNSHDRSFAMSRPENLLSVRAKNRFKLYLFGKARILTCNINGLLNIYYVFVLLSLTCKLEIYFSSFGSSRNYLNN